MRRMMLFGAALAVMAAGCGGGGGEPMEDESAGGESETEVEVVATEEAAPATAMAQMEPTEGNDVQGTIRFVQQDDGVMVSVDLTGFEPGSEHGFHIHENGDCSAPDGTSAGGHYNPAGVDHALPPNTPRHAGDMGNVTADGDGEVHEQETFDTFSVNDADPPPIVGHAVIVHAEPDDGGQPTGNAGARVACGVIEAE